MPIQCISGFVVEILGKFSLGWGHVYQVFHGLRIAFSGSGVAGNLK